MNATYHRSNVTKPAKTAPVECIRCFGGKRFTAFAHIESGRCFRCGGHGVDPKYTDWTFPADWSDEQCESFVKAKADAAQARRDKAHAKRQAKAEAVWLDNVARCPSLVRWIESIKSHEDAEGCQVDHRQWTGLTAVATSWEWGVIWGHVFKDTWRTFRLSDKQVALIESIAAKCEDRLVRRAAEKAAEIASQKPVPTGRVAIEGTVVSLKESHLNVGYRQTVTQIKALVKCDGYKLFGTVPAAIVADCKVGDTIRFTATVQPKEPGFGFFSRPTGAEILALT